MSKRLGSIVQMVVKRLQGAAKRDDRSFTIMVLPHSGERAVSFPLRISWLRVGAALATVAMLALCVLCVRYARMSVSEAQYHSELDRLRRENSTQKALLEDYERGAAEAVARLDRLEALDRQIRELIDRETPVLSARSRGSQAWEDSRKQRVAVAEVSRSGLGTRRMGLFAALIEEASVREDSLLSLKEGLVETIAFLRAKPSIVPTLGSITSVFGYRRSPISRSRTEFHEGIDIGAPYGAPIKASGDGVVIFSGYHGGLGRTVIIDHGYGIRSWYGHCYKLAVRQGEEVTRGRVIAYVGSSGLSTGPHLHYQVTVDGKYVDPKGFFEVSEAQ